jgi:hypothetical protein
MRITRLEFPLCGTDPLGIKQCEMSRLGHLVVLTGPNGGGKSRLLITIAGALGRLNPQEVARAKQNIAKVDQGASLRMDGISDQDIETMRETVELDKRVSVEHRSQDNSFSWFQPSDLNETGLGDYRKRTSYQLQEDEESLRGPVAANLSVDKAISVLLGVARRAFNANHPDLEEPPDRKQAAIAERNELYELVEHLLGAKPKLNLDRDPTLFDRPLFEGHLSPGQLLLLQMAVDFHTRGKKLDHSILFLDEPERHLHPRAGRCCGTLGGCQPKRTDLDCHARSAAAGARAS